MSLSERTREKLTGQFIDFATKLSGYFPELDLRFNLQNGSKTVRFTLPGHTNRVFEAELGQNELDSLVYEAAFAVKEMVRKFDA
jgi:hypothetical protein